MREAASFIASQAPVASAGALPALGRALRDTIRAISNRGKVRRLSDLDDHLLADLGLCAEDVRWALDLPFSYDPARALQQRALRRRSQGWRG
jgi:uncharacterized protein YjiS (DUF1127 family)